METNEFAAELEVGLMAENLYTSFLEAKLEGNMQEMDAIISYALDFGLSILVETMEAEYGN